MLDESADQRGVLPLDQETQGQTVRDILKKKHPAAQPTTPDTLMPEEANQPHPVIDNITGEAITACCHVGARRSWSVRTRCR